MLAHMLPNKLSKALIERDTKEIQQTLDSNFGLFGLVVTDCKINQPKCPNQRIVYESTSKLVWRELLDENTLAKSNFDVLRDPPPFYSEARYTSISSETRNATGINNQGKIIGRVYYVRGTPPSFESAYLTWIRGWPTSFESDSGNNKLYALTNILFGVVGVETWIGLELFLAKRKLHADFSY
jgi:hypothetical protein